MQISNALASTEFVTERWSKEAVEQATTYTIQESARRVDSGSFVVARRPAADSFEVTKSAKCK
jgi:hypothetical protein